ncbi:non-ribosomal peptide synthetase [Pseudoalteromonas prydzensis]|uniref:Non-ribosomal peptide synthetase n=1 Tax=Pseudoalteromonas prydzensis TaxID=182141 RepID=A0ABR9FS99_9GAMM|nr:non-ribosomal peptide synthetase [Pseudoalteromonas prydzensis]MBE0459708.1 non-ribosomal peptide synthetase [Pseudoalteromonas prydzensis]
MFGKESKLHFLKDIGQISYEFSYLSLYEQSAGVSYFLNSKNQRGKSVILALPQEPCFFVSILGCMFSGSIAVPIAIPNKRNKERISRLSGILSAIETEIIITTQQNVSIFEGIIAEFEISFKGRIIAIEDILEQKNPHHSIRPQADCPAIIQFSSGTTGIPKGVVITHRNISQNYEIIRGVFKETPDSVVFCWLPLFHDMGLFGNFFQVIISGLSCYYIKPEQFVQRPEIWVQGISYYRANISGGPNFAYDLVASRISEQTKEGLDLSCWTTAFNGAEVIQPRTLERFTDCLGSQGFNENSFLPCYGLAEATLFVAGSHLGDLPLGMSKIQHPLVAGKDLQCSGKVSDLGKVRIVDPKAQTVMSDGQIGEIWISGHHTTSCYWNESELTTKLLNASLLSCEGERFVRTGDMGLVKDSHLYVTGRLKEMVVIRGRNYYPTDIESALCGLHDAFFENGVVAFSIEHDGEERLVIIQEIKRTYVRKIDTKMLENSIKAKIVEFFNIKPDAVGLVLQGSIARTSSGKLKRLAMVDYFKDNAIKFINVVNLSQKNHSSDSTSAIQTTSVIALSGHEQVLDYLISRIEQETNTRGIMPDQPLFELGVDSMLAAKLTGELAKSLNKTVEPTIFWEHDSLEEIVSALTV